MNNTLILGGLAALLAIPTVMTVMAERATFTDFDRVPYLFEGFTPENITVIRLSKVKWRPDGAPGEEDAASSDGEAADPKDSKSLYFVREQGGWVLGTRPDDPNPLAGVPVQAGKIETDILDHLQSIRLDRKALIGEDVSPDDLAAYGLTEETGIQITCLNQQRQPVADLFRGRDASGGGQWAENQVRGFFVRPVQRNDIVLYEPNPPYWFLGLKASDWLDLQIHSFPARDAERFTFRNPKGAVSLVRNAAEQGTPKWRVEAGPAGLGELRQQEVGNVLQRFNLINCTRYLGRLDDPAWADKVPGEDAKIMVSATLQNGSTYTMWVGEKIPNTQEYYARAAGPAGPGGFLVAIGEWDRSPYENDPASLFEPAPAGGAPVPPPDPAVDPVQQPGKDGEDAAGGAAPSSETGDAGGAKPDTPAPGEQEGGGSVSRPTPEVPK